MCEFCEEDKLLKVEIVYHYLAKTENEYLGKIQWAKERHLKVNHCPICGRDLRKGNFMNEKDNNGHNS